MTPRPNILYLHSHDTGRYIQPYGHAVATPRLQRFAEQGVLFRQAFCAAPTCSASRAALLTGMYPHCNGMLGLVNRGSRMADYRWHLANYLRSHGYETALSGVQHEVAVESTKELGYDVLTHSHDAGESASKAAAYLRRAHDRPFFLSCGFFLTHRTGTGIQWYNYGESPTGDPRYVRPPAPLPDTPEIRRDFADFAVAAGRLDAAMGTVLDALDQAGLSDNTLVIVTTDHGLAFPQMKCNLTDHGTGVMLMLRGPSFAQASEGKPAGFTGGKVVDALASHVDLFPTLCEVAGLPAPDWLQGRSLVSLLQGAPAVRDEVFAEVNWHAALEPMRSVRTTRYKYIRRYAPRPGPVLPNWEDCVSKNELRAAGWDAQPLPAEALYDLMVDPNESCNLLALRSPELSGGGGGGAGDPQCAAVLQDMRARLDRWMRETRDPLLTGRLDPSPGMVVNPADDESPQGPTVPATTFTFSEGYQR
jgi:N-sulfoglucosamine sulfohydrolase